MPINPRISLSWLPSATERKMDFLESSFFQNRDPHKDLPAPQEVRALSKQPGPQPDPVKFEELGLIVKFGPHVAVEEALCLWAITNVLHDDIPVPEVYGWRVDGSDVFIYMELIQGVTLMDRWDTLNDDEKTTICNQLQKITTSFRRLEQDPEDIFIGSINRGALQEYVFEGKPKGGPFTTVSHFNDWFSQVYQYWLPESKRFPDPYRSYFPDNAAITFTHGDLHRNNIVITPACPPRVLAIVDWAHGGWYPDYWEYRKAAYTSSFEGEWLGKWVPKFLTPYSEEHVVFGEYCMALGSV